MLPGARKWRNNFVYYPQAAPKTAGTILKYLALSWILHNLPMLEMRKERVSDSCDVT